MSLQLFDSATHELREFRPIKPGEVGIYLCGPTVQSSPHVGHLRSALVYDQLRNWLEHLGFKVTFIRNVTDIDDKVLENAASSQQNWWALAYRFEQEFNAAYQALGIRPPSYEPRATASIPEMLELIDLLVERGHAYQAQDGSANVYFSVRSWPSYGELTNQGVTSDIPIEDTEPGATGKRDPLDFALWKASKPGEPATASWPSQFGAGRPGWHIECSAMSTKYLGENFDIHGGGLDLRFPHHENELAQSKAAGHKFANFWLHNGLVTIAGNKMSKSLGNSVFAADFLSKASPLVVRYYLGSAHYRSTLDYHEGVLSEAAAALERIEAFLKRASRRLANTKFAVETPQRPYLVPADFSAAMDDDLAVPAALAVLHEAIRTGNTAIDEERLDIAADQFKAVWGMTEILGINPLTFVTRDTASDSYQRALGALVADLIAERRAARQAKDFARADAIRDQLQAAGITLEDAADETLWSVNG